VSIPANTACDDATSIWNLVLLFLFLLYNTFVPILIAIKLWRMRRALAGSRAASGDVGKRVTSTLAVMGMTVAFFLVIGLFLVPVLLKNPVMQPVLGTLLQDVIVSVCPCVGLATEEAHIVGQILLPALIIFWVSVGVYRTSAIQEAASRDGSASTSKGTTTLRYDSPLTDSFPAAEKTVRTVDDV
jgi:hypothetical protein